MPSDDELIASILMVLCFVPVVVWLVLTAADYAWYQWIRPRICKDRILREVAWMGKRSNYRVLR